MFFLVLATKLSGVCLLTNVKVVNNLSAITCCKT